MPHAASDRTRKLSRTDGPCPIMRTCGGCEWLNLPYRKQLARKQAAMADLFAPLIERFGWSIELDPILGMGEHGTVTLADGKLAAPRAFRHKAATPFAPGDRGRVRCGFYARGTHDLVFSPACAVEAPGARELLNNVSRIATRLHLAAYDEDCHTGLLRHAVVRCSWRTDEVMLTLVTRERELPRQHALANALREAEPRLVTIAQNVNPRVTNAILGGETRILYGAPRMRDELLGCTFEISPASFYQTNPAQTEALYRLATDGLQLRDGDTLLDAYCGSGTIGLTALHAARAAHLDVHLLGVERNVEGIRDAQHNARLNGLEEHATFISGDATDYLQRAAAEGMRLDALILDPPRAGSTTAFLMAAASTHPRRIAYISCNPATQARDLAVLGENGYRLVRLTPVDMFPHTAHTETVALLERVA